MRETSREPTLSDSARWLGAPQEQQQSRWWDDVLDCELSEKARIRLGAQLHYLVRLGIEVDHSILEAAVAEAIEHGAARQDVPEVGADEIIYYLRIGPLVKIGYTSCYWQRVRAYPPDAVLLANEPGDRSLELQRHHQFRDSLARGREWFYPSSELIQHINSLRDLPLSPAQLAA